MIKQSESHRVPGLFGFPGGRAARGGAEEVDERIQGDPNGSPGCVLLGIIGITEDGAGSPWNVLFFLVPGDGYMDVYGCIWMYVDVY